jgi:hypothetical protein
VAEPVNFSTAFLDGKHRPVFGLPRSLDRVPENR